MPKTALLFIHGIVGTPAQFNRFLPFVPNEHTVVNLLLDGHGGSVRDFSKTSMKKWQSQVKRAADDLLKTHEHLIVVGHSMGTLFAIRRAVEAPGRIKGLFLIASPLSVRPRLRNFKNSMLTCLGIRSADPIANAAKVAYGIEPDRRFWRYLGWIPRYMELLSGIRKTRPLVKQLSVPCVVVQSCRDEVVGPRAASYFAGNKAVKLVLLQNSGHYYYPPEDWNVLQTKFTEFLKNTLE